MADDIAEDSIGSSFARTTDTSAKDATVEVAGNAKLTAGGDITGANGGTLLITVDGTVELESEGDVDISSTQSLDIAEITAEGDVAVTALGNITSSNTDAAITGASTSLDAISPTDGESTIESNDGSALKLDTDSLDLSADTADITVDGDVELGDITAEDVTITAAGDVTQKEGTQVDAESLTVNAKGDVDLTTDVDKLDVNTNGDVHVDNSSDELEVNISGKDVEIKTDGSITTGDNGKIKADNLTITALDEAGTDDSTLKLEVSGEIEITSIREGVEYVNELIPIRTIENRKAGIRLTGGFAENAVLEVINTVHYAYLFLEDFDEVHPLPFESRHRSPPAQKLP